MSEKQTYELTVVRWEGRIHCAYLNDFRIAGQKPWAGGETAATWKVTAEDILRAVPEISKPLADRIEQLERDVQYWKLDSAAAWDKCEERRQENEALERSNKELREALDETVTQYEMLLVEAYDTTHKKLAGKSPVVRKARAALSAADAKGEKG